MNPEKIRILGICASSRHGNSLFLLQKSLDVLRGLAYGESIEVEQAHFKNLTMGSCTGCEGCAKCIIGTTYR
jgi:multimeric flavodoxin WrbA